MGVASFILQVMFATHGDPAFAERAEKIAYNALPATWASPRGGDMWAHQYLQAVNEINAIDANPHVWQNDGPLAETYGLEDRAGIEPQPCPRSLPTFLFPGRHT